MADTVLSQKISQLPGVGLVSISGGQKPAVRVQANPTALASYGLSLEDLRTALGNANVNQAKGNLDSPQQAFTIWANDQLLTSDSYKPIVIAYKNGAPVRIMDVADVIDSAENVKLAAWENDKPAVIVNIQRQPGANIINVVDRIQNLLPQLKASLPSSVQVSILTDRTTTIRASVGRAIRTDAHGRAGRAGDLFVPAQRGGNRDTQRGRAAFAGGHIRRDVSARV
jgi:multidrug efflux pump